MTSVQWNNIWSLKILQKTSFMIYAEKPSPSTRQLILFVTQTWLILTLCFFCSCRRTEDPQEEVPIFQISDPRTRKGIFFQCIHQQRETHATVTDAQPHRPTSEDLVSKPSHEGEEVEQRQITVLHIQPSSLGVKSSTVLSLPSSAAGPTVFTDFPACTLCSMQRRRCWVVRFKFEDMSFEFSKKKHELMWAIVLFSGPFFEREKSIGFCPCPENARASIMLDIPFDGMKSAVNETGSMYFVIKRFIWPLFSFKIRNVVELK